MKARVTWNQRLPSGGLFLLSSCQKRKKVLQWLGPTSWWIDHGHMFQEAHGEIFPHQWHHDVAEHSRYSFPLPGLSVLLASLSHHFYKEGRQKGWIFHSKPNLTFTQCFSLHGPKAKQYLTLEWFCQLPKHSIFSGLPATPSPLQYPGCTVWWLSATPSSNHVRRVLKKQLPNTTSEKCNTYCS